MSSPDQSEHTNEPPYFTHEDFLRTVSDHVQGVLVDTGEVLEGDITRVADKPRSFDPYKPRTYDTTPVKRFLISVNPTQDRDSFRKSLLRQIFRVRMESRNLGLRPLAEFQAETARIEGEIDLYYESDKAFIDAIIERHFPQRD